MKTAGIIAEYNPMHNGHIYHLEKTRQISKAGFVVCVMSGNFTQRGLPAVLDKWTRAGIAVRNGADLVLEMPFVWATGSAEIFARGGVGILKGIGATDCISFGSESGDLNELKKVADLLAEEPDEYKAVLKKHLDEGSSFPAARHKAVGACLGEKTAGLIAQPNNILSVEYLKQIGRTMEPVLIRREGEYGDEKLPEDKNGKPSAAAVRKMITDGRTDELSDYVPEDCLEEIRNNEEAFRSMEERYFDLLRTVILRSGACKLAEIPDVTEGIENRIMREIRLCSDLDMFASSVKSRRFTRTAVNRMMLHILAGMNETAPDEVYTRVLAFSEKGRSLLREISQSCTIPVITNLNKTEELPDGIEYDIIASDLYNILMGKDLYENSEYVKRPVII